MNSQSVFSLYMSVFEVFKNKEQFSRDLHALYFYNSVEVSVSVFTTSSSQLFETSLLNSQSEYDSSTLLTFWFLFSSVFFISWSVFCGRLWEIYFCFDKRGQHCDCGPTWPISESSLWAAPSCKSVKLKPQETKYKTCTYTHTLLWKALVVNWSYYQQFINDNQ